MSITAIARNFDGNPNIVTIVSDDTLATITTTGYLTGADIAADIELLQNGEFQWTETDLVLMFYSPAQIGFFTHNAVNNTFDELAPSGGLPNTLQDGDIFVGNASNVATGVTPSGDITLTNAGVFGIAAGVIVNADINASAAIAYSKLAALTSGNILVGSAGNVPTSVAMTGDIAITNTGVTSIQAGAIVNADINAAAAIAFSKLATLATGHIIAGNAGVPTDTTVSGDITIGATGVTAIGAGKVLLAMLGAGIAPAGVIKFMGQPTTTGGSATEAFTVTGALAASDRAFVQIVNNGTNNVTVLQAVVTNDTLTITFSGDPAADTVFNYQLIRAAA
jgi:hypothetical protein